MIVAAEVVVVLGLLGVWGYRLAKENNSSAISQVETPKPTPAKSDLTSKSRPVSKPAAKPSSARLARNANTKPVQARPRTAAPTVVRDSHPLPKLRAPEILIEKSKQRLIVFDEGRGVKQYPASTGRNAGDKRREGDSRTPEGEFYVCVKNASSKYTRALGLSYPSISDAQRGLRDGLISRREYDRIVYAIRHRTQPPWKTALGGAIMIHGDRRGGRTTQGCIALEDRDILELFPKIPIGTRVVIRP